MISSGQIGTLLAQQEEVGLNRRDSQVLSRDEDDLATRELSVILVAQEPAKQRLMCRMLGPSICPECFTYEGLECLPQVVHKCRQGSSR